MHCGLKLRDQVLGEVMCGMNGRMRDDTNMRHNR